MVKERGAGGWGVEERQPVKVERGREGESKEREEESSYIRRWDSQVQGWWGGQMEALIKRKISLFNLETLPIAKPAKLWPAVWLVL